MQTRPAKRISSRHRAALAVLAMAAAGLPSMARPQEIPAPEPPPSGPRQEIDSLWSDPGFQKQFLGSYGFQADIEPRVTTVERELLEKTILPLMSSDPAKAREEIEKVLGPGSSALFDFILGNLAFQSEDLEVAATSYQLALEKFPSFRRARKNLGLIRVREGRYQEAVNALSKVVELGGGDGLVMGLLGYSHGALGRHVAAESAYREAALLQPEEKDWKLGLTQSLVKQRKWAEAASLIQELIAEEPERADLWLLQANAWIGLDQPLKAAENFELLDRMGQATPASLNILGDIYVNEGLWDLAARAYTRALELDEGRKLDRPLRAIEVLAQRGALVEAKGILERVKKLADAGLAGEDRRKLLKLEARLAVAGGEGGEAADVLEEIVALDPLDGEALMLLGRHHEQAGDLEQAAFYYERASSLEEHEAEASLRLAQLLVSQSRFGEAMPLLKRAQELNPREDVARYLEQVERIARSRN